MTCSVAGPLFFSELDCALGPREEDGSIVIVTGATASPYDCVLSGFPDTKEAWIND